MQAYKDILSQILETGTRRQEPRTKSYIISTFENLSFRHDMSEGFPLLTTKKVSLQNVAVELAWFLSGKTDLWYLLSHNCNIWNDDAYKHYLRNCKSEVSLEKKEFIELVRSRASDFADFNLGPIYGAQWRGKSPNQKVDQIRRLVKTLLVEPYARRHIVESWNVSDLEEMALPPCHKSFQCYVRDVNGERFLDLKWTQRSVDAVLGRNGLPLHTVMYVEKLF